MKLSRTAIRRTALALFAAALVVPAAQASVRPDNRAVGPRTDTTQQQSTRPDNRAVGPRTDITQPQSTRPDDRAGIRAVDGVVLGDREGNVWGIASSDTLANEPGGTSVDRPLSSYYTPQALKAMGDRYNAEAALAAGSAVRPDDRAGIRGVEQQPPTVYISPSRGFDWSDAGIGAVSAFGASLLLAGLMLLAVHQRRQHKVAAF